VERKISAPKANGFAGYTQKQRVTKKYYGGGLGRRKTRRKEKNGNMEDSMKAVPGTFSQREDEKQKDCHVE